FEVSDVPDLGALVAAGIEAADLEDELRVAVIHHRDLRVGGLPLVLVAEPAADADDGLGEGRAGGGRGGGQPPGPVPPLGGRGARSPRTSASYSGPGWHGTAAWARARARC